VGLDHQIVFAVVPPAPWLPRETLLSRIALGRGGVQRAGPAASLRIGEHLAAKATNGAPSVTACTLPTVGDVM
jgi:hypothetical protein